MLGRLSSRLSATGCGKNFFAVESCLLGVGHWGTHRYSRGSTLAKTVPPNGEASAGKSTAPSTMEGDKEMVDVLVCGAHLQGLPLNSQLTDRGATLKSTTHTASIYRMYALAGGPPYRPGLVRDVEKGAAIEVEVWSMPMAQFGSFVHGIPAPLGIGKVQLADGGWVCGFICEPYGIEGAEEITGLGGWRAYMSRKQAGDGIKH